VAIDMRRNISGTATTPLTTADQYKAGIGSIRRKFKTIAPRMAVASVA
jgi:hypothetical protein